MLLVMRLIMGQPQGLRGIRIHVDDGQSAFHKRLVHWLKQIEVVVCVLLFWIRVGLFLDRFGCF